MRVLFTGSSGPKVGATVAAQLARSHEIIGIDLAPGLTATHVTDIVRIDDWSLYLEGVDAIVHFAALHAPHRESHSRDAFQALNVEATARLLVAAKQSGVAKFVLASSTSVYGKAKLPANASGRAAWVTEAMQPIAEDIYDETKLAAEALCADAFAPDFQTMALRFSRSFPEPLPQMAAYRLHRGVDARDVASAFERALGISVAYFEAINISGYSPFAENDCEALWHDAPSVLRVRVPRLVEAFSTRGWILPKTIDRVYATGRAEQILGFRSTFGWESVIPPDVREGC